MSLGPLDLTISLISEIKHFNNWMHTSKLKTSSKVKAFLLLCVWFGFKTWHWDFSSYFFFLTLPFLLFLLPCSCSLKLELTQGRCGERPQVFLDWPRCRQTVDQTWSYVTVSLSRRPLLTVDNVVRTELFHWMALMMTPPSVLGSLHSDPSVEWPCSSRKPCGGKGIFHGLWAALPHSAQTHFLFPQFFLPKPVVTTPALACGHNSCPNVSQAGIRGQCLCSAHTPGGCSHIKTSVTMLHSILAAPSMALKRGRSSLLC